MFWVRVDNRLVHGQVIEAWLPYTGAGFLVVANEALAADPIQQEIMSLAIPSSVKAVFLPLSAVSEYVSDRGTPPHMPDMLILFQGTDDARMAFTQGLRFDSLNIGNVHYAPGKKQLCPHVAVSGADEENLRFFNDQGVELDFRCVPNEPVQVRPVW